MIGRTNCSTGGSELSSKNAVIHIIASVGSTVILSKEGIVVKELGPEKSYPDASNNNLAHWFYEVTPSNYGTWTVAISWKSKTITIENNQQYDVNLFQLYIYNYGDLCTEVTGGYTAYGMKQNSSYGGTAKAPTISYDGKGTVTESMSSGGGMWRTVSSFDVTNWSTFKMEYNSVVAVGHVNCALISTLNQYWDSLGKVAAWQPSSTTAAGEIKSIDLTNITGSVYFGTCLLYAGGNTSIKYTRMWLE